MTGQPEHAGLRILATSDLHMHLLGFDYYTDRPRQDIGLTRVATLIAQARGEAASEGRAVILCDNGDSLQGTPMGDRAIRTGPPHPFAEALDLLKYDVIGLGNHDFDFGLDALHGVLRQVGCPIVSSSVELGPAVARLPILPCTVLERHLTLADQRQTLRIGVFSVLPAQTAMWNAHHLTGRLSIIDMQQAAQKAITTLKKRRSDLIICLGHTGIGHEHEMASSENALQQLAALKDIDALIGGHTHLAFPASTAEPGILHETPTVMPGYAGSHLGVIDLELCRPEQSGWQVKTHKAMLRLVGTDTPEDTALTTRLAEPHAATRKHLDRPVGHSTLPLNSFFSFLLPDTLLNLVADAQIRAVRRLYPDLGDLPVLSAASPEKFGARSGPNAYANVPAGPLRWRNVADIYTFPDTLRAVQMTGAQVIDWLEMAATVFRQIKPGQTDQPLLDKHVPGHLFDVIHGLQYVIDPSQPPRFDSNGTLIDGDAHRISHVLLRGQPLDPQQPVIVAVKNYRANGGGHAAALAEARMLPIRPVLIQDLIAQYIRDPTKRIRRPDPTWTFKALRDTTVTVETSPAAIEYITHPLTADGLTEAGFLKVSMPLSSDLLANPQMQA